MTTTEKLKLSSEILKKAKEFGATLAGITNVTELMHAPSYTVTPQMPEYNGVGTGKEKLHDNNTGEVVWPEGAVSVVVIAYVHPEEHPDLDYWYGRISPVGNKKLIAIADKLIQWLAQKNYAVNPAQLPYHIERGGIYLKDAAVLAGLGCIGKNNLLVTPEYGPRIRLRAFTLNIDLPSTGPIQFDPCVLCDERCIKVCPQQAFKEKIYSAKQYGREELPGRNGCFDRLICNRQMKLDESIEEFKDVEGHPQPLRVTRYCRHCEFSCPVGKGS